MRVGVVQGADASALTDPIVCGSSWCRARRASDTLIDNVSSGSFSAAGSAVANLAGGWLALALRTGWIGRHVVGREVDLDDVEDWVSVMHGRLPLAVSCLLGEAARSPERWGRVAAAVALREWASLPHLDHSAQLVELTPLLARQLLLLVLAPGVRG